MSLFHHSNPSLVRITPEDQALARVDRPQLSPVSQNTMLVLSLSLYRELDLSRDDMDSLFPSSVATRESHESAHQAVLPLSRPRPPRRNRWRRMYDRFRRSSHPDSIRRHLLLHRVPSTLPPLTTSPLLLPDSDIPRDEIGAEEYYEALTFRFDSSLLSRSTSINHPMIHGRRDVIIRRGTWHQAASIPDDGPAQHVRRSESVAGRIPNFFQHAHHSSSPQLDTPLEEPFAVQGDDEDQGMSFQSDDDSAVENPHSQQEFNFTLQDNFDPRREEADEARTDSQHIVLPTFSRVRRSWSQVARRYSITRRVVVTRDTYEVNHEVLERLKRITIGSLDTTSTSSSERDAVRSRRRSLRFTSGQAGELYAMMGNFDEFFEDPLKMKSNVDLTELFQSLDHTYADEPIGPPPTRCSESSFVFEPITLHPIPHIYT